MPMRLWILPRATLLVALCAALTACASSGAIRPGLEPNPVIKTERKVETVCPAALTLDDPPAVILPPAAEVSGNRDGLDWVAAHIRREALLGSRLKDARADCPKPPSP